MRNGRLRRRIAVDGYRRLSSRNAEIEVRFRASGDRLVAAARDEPYQHLEPTRTWILEWLSWMDRFGPSVTGAVELAICRRAALRHHFRRLLVWRVKERNKARYERHLAALEQKSVLPRAWDRPKQCSTGCGWCSETAGTKWVRLRREGRTCRASRGPQSNRASSGAYVATTFGIGRVTLGS